MYQHNTFRKKKRPTQHNACNFLKSVLVCKKAISVFQSFVKLVSPYKAIDGYEITLNPLYLFSLFTLCLPLGDSGRTTKPSPASLPPIEAHSLYIGARKIPPG